MNRTTKINILAYASEPDKNYKYDGDIVDYKGKRYFVSLAEERVEFIGIIKEDKLKMKAIKENWKLVLIVVAGIVAVIFMCIFGIQGAQNKAFALEEQVNTADSDIKVQEKRRVDLVYNLADCVKQYDKHEAETLTAIVEGRGKSNQYRKCNHCNNGCYRGISRIKIQ